MPYSLDFWWVLCGVEFIKILHSTHQMFQTSPVVDCGLNLIVSVSSTQTSTSMLCDARYHLKAFYKTDSVLTHPIVSLNYTSALALTLCWVMYATITITWQWAHTSILELTQAFLTLSTYIKAEENQLIFVWEEDRFLILINGEQSKICGKEGLIAVLHGLLGGTDVLLQMFYVCTNHCRLSCYIFLSLTIS